MSILDKIPDLPPCDSPFWGKGEILDKVQKARIYNDSKIFVDLPLKYSPHQVMENFKKIPNQPNPAKTMLRKFVRDNFILDLEIEFEDWDPEDWHPHPAYLDELTHPRLIQIGKEVNKLWKTLSQKCSDDMKRNPENYSQIPLPNGFIMPGGRFREIYYWDTFWIVLGLIHSEMYHSVKGNLENFIYQIKQFGHVPNGTRRYYERRSQPPFLISMMDEYIKATNDVDFLLEAMPYLDKEIKFFENNRMTEYKWTNGKSYKVFFYSADCRGPRPEAYVEDMEVAEKFFHDNEEAKEEFFLHMKAAAESGWDFSTRWFIDKKGGNTGGLANAKTYYILPVDLNALMFKNYQTMANFNKLLNFAYKRQMYQKKAKNMMNTMMELFWCPRDHMWYDIDRLNHKRRRFFYASNLFPLWAEAYPPEMRDEMGKHAVNYLVKSGVSNHKGGIPASLMHGSKQQWDWNAWPPVQHLIVSGLNKTGNPKAERAAFQIAQNYAMSIIATCDDGECDFYEKYHPTKRGEAGGGGEYEVQTGFGWTNGVLIDFVVQYGDALVEREKPRVENEPLDEDEDDDE